MDLCRAMNDDTLSMLVQAALVHPQLETIHPFDHGNGRKGARSPSARPAPPPRLARSGEVERPVVVAVIAVLVEQAAADQVVRVISVGDGLVPTGWPVSVLGSVPRGGARRALVGIPGVDRDAMLVDVVLVGMVEMPVVQEVRVTLVHYCRVAAAGPVLMRVPIVGVVCHGYPPHASGVMTARCRQLSAGILIAGILPAWLAIAKKTLALPEPVGGLVHSSVHTRRCPVDRRISRQTPRRARDGCSFLTVRRWRAALQYATRSRGIPRERGHSGLHALGAASVEHQLVSIELEAGWHERTNPSGASGNLEDPFAGAATEMVVMLGARGLVPGWFARQLDRDEYTFGHECLERPIHGRSTQPWHLCACAGEDLAGRERSSLTLDSADNRGALPCRSFHLRLAKGWSSSYWSPGS
jgi:hypothetical protein